MSAPTPEPCHPWHDTPDKQAWCRSVHRRHDVEFEPEQHPRVVLTVAYPSCSEVTLERYRRLHAAAPALLAALRELTAWFAFKPGALTAGESLLAAALSRARAALAAAEGRTP